MKNLMNNGFFVLTILLVVVFIGQTFITSLLHFGIFIAAVAVVLSVMFIKWCDKTTA